MALHPSSVSCHPQGLSQPFLVPRGHSVLASIGTRTANICIHSLLRGKTCSISDRGDTMPLNIIPVSLLTNALKLSVLTVPILQPGKLRRGERDHISVKGVLWCDQI